MPRAEVGTTKHLANKMKAKGLQRLRWYCQVCERQMRDENGFKCHTQSQSHVQQMLLVGEDPKKHIENYSNQFQRDFLTQLRTGHGEKKVDANRFYQEYIGNKEHVHMNATKWVTLTEFVKFIGREGIVRVEEGERGPLISWIDNSAEALRRQEVIRKKERMDRGDEIREQKLIKEQVERAKKEAGESGKLAEVDERKRRLQREEGETVKLALNVKTAESPEREKKSATPENAEKTQATLQPAKVSMKIEAKPKNVFASMGKKDKRKDKEKEKKGSELKRPMSEAERIMKGEMERNKSRNSGPPGLKRQRVM
jgi:DNA/RNA-binding protein KIN17